MLRLLLAVNVLFLAAMVLFGIQAACEPVNLGPVDKSEVGKRWSEECLDHYDPNAPKENRDD